MSWNEPVVEGLGRRLVDELVRTVHARLLPGAAVLLSQPDFDPGTACRIDKSRALDRGCGFTPLEGFTIYGEVVRMGHLSRLRAHDPIVHGRGPGEDPVPGNGDRLVRMAVAFRRRAIRGNEGDKENDKMDSHRLRTLPGV